MRWRTGRRSQNIEDRRGASPNVGMPTGFPDGMNLPRRRRRGPIGRRGGIGLVIVVLAALYFGADPGLLFEAVTTEQLPSSGGPTASASASRSAAEQELAEFVSVVLADTEDTWHALFAEMDARYEEPTLVLFSDPVRSACGLASAAVGPFYCPADRKVYVDLAFYDELRTRFGAPGDLAQAYVIAHGIGHHVQTLLGIAEQVRAAQSRAGPQEANALSVRQELQADCFAGIWAHHADRTRQLLEQGDIEEALNAAAAIGDDRIQRQTQGYVVPESFTHGSAAQRQRWFQRGWETGDLRGCDTFSTKAL